MWTLVLNPFVGHHAFVFCDKIDRFSFCHIRIWYVGRFCDSKIIELTLTHILVLYYCYAYTEWLVENLQT